MTARQSSQELQRAERLVRAVGWRIAAWRIVLILGVVAAVLSGAALVAGSDVGRPGSPLPLVLFGLGAAGLAASGFVAGLASQPSGRRSRSREVERSCELGMGALTAALELGRPEDGSSELARLHRDRIAGALRGRSQREILPAASGRIRTARRAAVPTLGLAAALVLSGSLQGPGVVGPGVKALTVPWKISFPPPPPPLRIASPAGEALRGSSLRVSVEAEGRSTVDLVQRRAGLALHRESLEVVSGRAEADVGPVRESIRLWAEDGRGTSDTVEIVPVDPLSVTELSVDVTFPGYLGRSPEVYRDPVPSLALPTGSSLRVRARTNHPVARLALVRRGASGRDTIELDPASGMASGSLTVVETVELSWLLKPAAAVPGVRLPLPLSVTVLPDEPPSVSITYPGADRIAGLEREFPIVVEARDDHALAGVALVWWREASGGRSDAPVTEELAEPAGARRVTLRPTLDLSAAGLMPGDVIAYHATARDRRPGSRSVASRTYRVRVTGIRELRSAVEERTGTLAADARSLHERTRQLETATREAERRNEPAATGLESRSPAEPADSKLTQDARELLSEAEAVEAQARELQRSLRATREDLAESPLRDPDLERRLGELEALYSEILESGLGERIEELQAALQQLRGDDVRRALSDLSRQAAALEDRLDRAMGLLERVAAEQSLEGSRQRAEELASGQARDSERPDGDESWADRQSQRAADADSLVADVNELAQKLEDLGARDVADGVRRAAEQASAGAESMRSAGSDSGGHSSEAEARKAAGQLRQAESDLTEAAESLAEDWRAEAMRTVASATSQALELAREQQRVVDQLRAGARPEELASTQSAIREGLDNLTQSLAEAGKQTALLDRRSGPAAAQAGREMDAAGQSLTAGAARREEGERHGEAAMEALSDLAGSLMAAHRAMSEAASGTGMEEALERLAAASQRQAGLNAESGELLLLMEGGQPVEERLQGVGEEQARISDELRRISETTSGELGGRPGELAEEADRLARELTEGTLDREVLARQERLFRRLLDAGRSLEKDEEDPLRREATSARPGLVLDPGVGDGQDPGLRHPYPDAAALESLSASQRRIVYDYFDRLNAQPASDER